MILLESFHCVRCYNAMASTTRRRRCVDQLVPSLYLYKTAVLMYYKQQLLLSFPVINGMKGFLIEKR